MKKLFVVLGLLLIGTMLFIGCGKTDNSATTQNVLPPQDFNKTGTLQGKIIDATTGAALGNDADSELKIWLIQGTDDRGPSKLINDKNNPLCGEYAFSGIPVQFYAGDIAYKVVVIKNGYQRFESADITFNVVSATTTTILDTTYNWVKNIYLFPVGATAAAANVYVVNPANRPVPGATVMLGQNIASNITFTASGETDRLGAAAGLITNLSATTDAAGMAAFAGSSLVLNGLYTPVVLPILFDGQQLVQQTGTAFYIGVDNPNQYIQMIPGVGSNGAYLYITASNNLAKPLITTGVLTMTFNRKIALASGSTTTNLCTADNGLIGNAVFSSPSVTATISSPDGLTLTLTPIITTASTLAGSSIVFSCSIPGLLGSAGIIATDAPTTAGVDPLTRVVNDTGDTLTGIGADVVKTSTF